MIVKILGGGCANCEKLEKLAREAAVRLDLEVEFVKVTEMADIMAYGVMSTPALVVDEELRLAGRVPELDEVVRVLESATA